MAYNQRNTGSARYDDYTDPISSEYNSWQGQNPSGYPGGYHGGYQQTPVPPPLATTSQNNQDASGWDWPDDDWDSPDTITNGFVNSKPPSRKPAKITKKQKINQVQPQFQNPNLFFDNFSTEQPSQPGLLAAFDNSDMGDQGVVRTGISYAAALSGPADNTPVPEEAPSSGFDDIDLDDDSQGTNAGHKPSNVITQPHNALGEAFGISAHPVANNTHPSSVQEEPHPADILAEAFSTSGTAMNKAGHGVNPFSMRQSPAQETSSDGKASPFDQSSIVQQQPKPVDAISDAFAVSSQEITKPEPSNMVTDAFAPPPPESSMPQNDMITDSFYPQAEEKSQPVQNGIESATSQDNNWVHQHSIEDAFEVGNSQHHGDPNSHMQDYSEKNSSMVNAFAVTTPPLPSTQSLPINTISNSSNVPTQDSMEDVETEADYSAPPPPPPTMGNSMAGGINPFRRSNTPQARSSGTASPFDYLDSSQKDSEENHLGESELFAEEQGVMESCSQYIPDDHRLAFANTNVTHKMPVNVRSSFDNQTHTIMSRDKKNGVDNSSSSKKDSKEDVIAANAEIDSESLAAEQHSVMKSFATNEYIPDDHRSPFANTNVTHEMPVVAKSSFDNKTHTITSSGKKSPFGYVYDTQNDNEKGADKASGSEQKSDTVDEVHNELDNPDDNEDHQDNHYEPHADTDYSQEWPALSNDHYQEQVEPEPNYYSSFQQPGAHHNDGFPVDSQPVAQENTDSSQETNYFNQPGHAEGGSHLDDFPVTSQSAVQDHAHPSQQTNYFNQPGHVVGDTPERDDDLHPDDGYEMVDHYHTGTSNAVESEFEPSGVNEPYLAMGNLGSEEGGEGHFAGPNEDHKGVEAAEVSHSMDKESDFFAQPASEDTNSNTGNFPVQNESEAVSHPPPPRSVDHEMTSNFTHPPPVDNTVEHKKASDLFAQPPPVGKPVEHKKASDLFAQPPVVGKPVEQKKASDLFAQPPPVGKPVEQKKASDLFAQPPPVGKPVEQKKASNLFAQPPPVGKPEEQKKSSDMFAQPLPESQSCSGQPDVSKSGVVSSDETGSSLNTSTDSSHSQVEADSQLKDNPSPPPAAVDMFTPPPPLVPTTGPMASMSSRQSREKKTRTPVSMSSLWSNQNSASGPAPFMLAPALVGPSNHSQQDSSTPKTSYSEPKPQSSMTNNVMPSSNTEASSTHEQSVPPNMYSPTPPLSQSSPAPHLSQGTSGEVFSSYPPSSQTVSPAQSLGSYPPMPVVSTKSSTDVPSGRHVMFNTPPSVPPLGSHPTVPQAVLQSNTANINLHKALPTQPGSSNAGPAGSVSQSQTVIPAGQPVAQTADAEVKKIDLDDPNLSKKERKAEKKRLKALAKEQKKALKKAAVGGVTVNQETKTTASENQGNPHGESLSNPHGNPHVSGNPHGLNGGNPHGLSAGNPHGSNTGNPHELNTGNPHGPNAGNPHGSYSGNPHGSHHNGSGGNPHPSTGNSHDEAAKNHHDTTSGNPHSTGNPHGSSAGNPHSNPDSYTDNPRLDSSRYYHEHHRNPSDLEHTYGTSRDDGHEYRTGRRSYPDSKHSDYQREYDNPRVRELRDDHYEQSNRQDYSRSKSPLRDIRAHDEYSHRERDSGGYSPRNSRDESYSRESYGAYDSPKQARDERYHGATRREIQKYGDHSDFDYPKRNRSHDYDHYETRRSQEDLSYLDRSYESVKSERLSREEYYDNYYRDRHREGSTDRQDSGFKPIHHDYRDPYGSHTPSSGSGRSSPAGNYGNYHGHEQGYYPHYPPYPGYDPYGYYQGHYGHMPYPYYHYPPYGYNYYQQYGAYGSGHGSAYSSGDASYQDQQQTQEQTEEADLDKEQEEEVQEVAPLRTTPLHFLRPHMTCRFGSAGKLLIVLPNHPDDGMKPLVEIQKLKVVFTQEEKDQIAAFPGPLTCRGTIKRQVLEFIQEKANHIQQSTANLASKQARWVLWKFFQSLVKHNGAVVTDDIAEMLMMSVTLFEKKKKKRHSSTDSSESDSSTSTSSTSSSDSTSSDSSDDSNEPEDKPVDHLLVYRGLLLEGHTKEALEYAMGNSLWGHAVLASGLIDYKGNNSLLDTKTSSGVITRFFQTLDKSDPLITLYEHLGGKVPHALKHHENWASNLAGIIANPTAFADKNKDNIVTLGDTLGKHPDLLFASHLCYLLAGIKPAAKSKMVLVGCDHRNKSIDKMATIESLQLTELLEYATSLENQEFFISNLQTFRYVHALKLMDAGMYNEAIGYLHVVGEFIMKNLFSFNDVFKNSVYKTSERLVGNMENDGIKVEPFISIWLKKLQQVIEGTDSEVYEPQNNEVHPEEDDEEEDDPLAQSSVSFYSGYDQSLTYHDKTSPGSTDHSVASRQPSVQSSMQSANNSPAPSHPMLTRKESDMSVVHQPLTRKDSQMSVAHSILSRKDSQLSSNSSLTPLHTLDLSQPMPSQIFQPGEPMGQQDSFPSQDQADGDNVQEDNFQASQGGFGYQQDQVGGMNNMWMPGSQQNNWSLPTDPGTTVSGDNEGERTPVNTAPTFDDFYRQSNPNAPSWQDDTSKTPTPGMQEVAPAKQDFPPKPAEPSKPKQEEKKPLNNKNASGGWFTGLTGLIQKVIPKGPNEVHLPDDSKKTIYFDKELNKWINTEESEEDRAPPPPPPTDAMIGGAAPPGIPSNGPPPPGRPMGAVPSTLSMPTNSNPVPGNQRNEPGTPPSPGTKAFGTLHNPAIPGMPGSGVPAGPPSKFSRKAQGRLGLQKKYVDVLNPNKGPSQDSPAVPSALFPVLPTAGGGSFQGTFFVPSAAPVEDNAESAQPPSSIQSGSTNEPHLPSQTNDDQNQPAYPGNQAFQPHEPLHQQQPLPQQTQFFDPSSFAAQPMPSTRRGRGRYPR